MVIQTCNEVMNTCWLWPCLVKRVVCTQLDIYVSIIVKAYLYKGITQVKMEDNFLDISFQELIYNSILDDKFHEKQKWITQ